MPSIPDYDDAYVQELFDRMGSTYDAVNLISSFGFSQLWRKQCVSLAGIKRGDVVCDLMAGGGECWASIQGFGASIISIDFSRVMTERQIARKENRPGAIDVRCENALSTSIADSSIDAVVCAFGLKTLPLERVSQLADEIHRILKPGGRFSFLEISTAESWWLGPMFRWYMRRAIPLIGKLCLGDIECYRMLWRYTQAFGSCAPLVGKFQRAGMSARLAVHFNGCATSISGTKT